jgi:hypothetical protein
VNGQRWLVRRCWGDLATALREVAESYVELTFGIWIQRVVLLIGESSGVERRDVDCAHEAREEALVYAETTRHTDARASWIAEVDVFESNMALDIL